MLSPNRKRENTADNSERFLSLALHINPWVGLEVPWVDDVVRLGLIRLVFLSAEFALLGDSYALALL